MAIRTITVPVRNALHAFGARHPFTFATIWCVAGVIVGAVFL